MTTKMLNNKFASSSVSEAVKALIEQMSWVEKYGQMTQVAAEFLLDPDDIATFGLGSLLNGLGVQPSSAFGGNTLSGWVNQYDFFQSKALSTRLGIPMLYGIDAVHGNGSLYGRR